MPAAQTHTTLATITDSAFWAAYDADDRDDRIGTGIIAALTPLFDGSAGVRGADDGYTCQCTIYHFTPQV